MSWIRWWGLGAFAVIVGGVMALWLLLADSFVRWAVESAGTRMVGAKVDVAAADVGFSPARLELRGLAVTNPDRPMRNAVELERLAFDIDWIGLLLDRVHIDEVSASGMRFGSERESSGAVLRTSRTVERAGLLQGARERAGIPPLEVPSAEEVLERESLRSPEVIAEARRTLDERREKLAQRLAELPDEKKLKGYRRKVDKATEDGDGLARLQGLKDLKEVVDDIRDDVERLQRARDEVSAATAEAGRIAKEARNAPQADIQRLYRKYTDPGAVAGELAHYLLGPRVEGWINQGWYWYGRLSPYLGGGSGGDAAKDTGPGTVPAARRVGRNVVYADAEAKPRVLIRRVQLSGAAGGGELDGKITDIASPATRWPQPLRMALAGRSVSGIDRLRLNAGIDRNPGEAPVTQLDLGALGADLGGLSLGPEGAVSARDGQADFRVSGRVRGNELDLDLDALVRDAAFVAADNAESILREVAGALDGAGRLEIGARVGGTVEQPAFELSSSLDGLLEPLVRNRLKQAASGFREQLASAVTERTGGSLKGIEQQTGRLQGLESELEDRLGAYEKLLDRARKPLD